MSFRVFDGTFDCVSNRVLRRAFFSVLVILLGAVLCGAMEKPAFAQHRKNAPLVEPWVPETVDPSSPFAELSKRGTKNPWMWTIRPRPSTITFRGEIDGKEFKGEFSKFTARVRFRPDDLEKSFIETTIFTRQITVDNYTLRAHVVRPEWLSTRLFPEARYVAVDFVDYGKGYYHAKGFLTLRGKTVFVPLLFRVAFKDEKTWPKGSDVPIVTTRFATVDGLAKVDLRQFGIGDEVEKAKGHLDPIITVRIKFEAERTPDPE